MRFDVEGYDFTPSAWMRRMGITFATGGYEDMISTADDEAAAYAQLGGTHVEESERVRARIAWLTPRGQDEPTP